MGGENSRPAPQEPPRVQSVQYNNPRGIYSPGNGAADDKYKMYDYDSTWLNRKPGEGQPPPVNLNGSAKNLAIPEDTSEDGKSEHKESRLKKFADDYAGSTSFHGIVWTRNADSIIGRLIWLAIVLGMAGFLIFQIYDRVRYYRSWPVTVDIQIKIGEVLTFPAVTICNTNTFKMSKAAAAGTYSDLHNFYINGELDRMKNKSMSLYDAIKELKHSKYDFIKNCTWKNEKCSADDFKEQLTDFGVCYTFNGYNGSTDFKKISQTGAQYGLQLLLNTEAYEAMAGPHGYGGVKIQVHHPMADPQVQDQGMSIPPKMSAFVGLTMEQAYFLEPPHGKCAKVTPVLGGVLAEPDRRGYSKSRCENECYATEVNKTCNCVSSYMPMLVGSTYCSLFQERTCASQVVNQVKASGVCSRPIRCPYNCVENFYHSFVTYAAMSESEAIRLAWAHSNDQDMSENFRQATVLRHQLVDELHQKEKALTFQSFSDLNKLMHLASSSQGLKVKLEEWYLIIKRDIEGESTRVLQDLSAATTEVRRSFDDTFSLSSLLTYLLGEMVNTRYAEEILGGKVDYHLQKSNLNQGFDVHKSMCVYWERELEGPYLALTRLLPETAKDITHTWENNKRMTVRTSVLNVWLSHAERSAPLIVDTFGNLLQEYKKFADYMKTTYCVRARSTDPNPTFNDAEKNLAKRQALEQMIRVSAAMNASTRALKNTDENMDRQSSEIYAVATALKQRTNMLNIRLQLAQRHLEELEALFQIVYPIFERFTTDFKTGKPPSKLDMLTELDHAMPKGKPPMLAYFTNLAKVISQDLEQFLQTMRDTDDIISSAITLLDENVDLDRVGVLMANSRPLQTNLSSMVTNFTGLADDFFNYARQLDGRLRVTFNASIGVDLNFIRDNFIQMNFYFQSLTYSTVERNPGYTWFSLLCDCGGSAGLYLGASLLSIVELIYFVAKLFKELILDWWEKHKMERAMKS